MARLVIAAGLLMAVVSHPSPATAASESGMGDDVLTGVDGSDQDGGSVNVVPDPTVAVVAQQSPPDGIYDTLAACESNSHWAANTGNGYYGGLQEDLVFWRRYGGLAYAPRPDLAGRGAQITVAQRGQAAQGWAAWPNCSRRLGLQ